MIFSMTGFGRASTEGGMIKITAEIKSLNSKQLDLMMRVPSYCRELEPQLRSMLADSLSRGKVELAVNIENCGEQNAVSLNIGTMAAYKRQIEEMCAALSIPMPQDWVGQLLRLPDVMKAQQHTLSEEETLAITQAVSLAADALTEFRKIEGDKLKLFFEEKIHTIGELLSKVEPFEQDRVTRLRERLTRELEKLPAIEIQSGRLEQEMIFYIEKLDVTEEKTRLRAHLNYFMETMAGEPGQGKKLGFIAQEMGREINTLGSKSNNAEMQRIVVMMKDQLEQIKEQVLNVL